jgi:periplasmic protein TonB
MPGEEHIMGYSDQSRRQNPFSLGAAVAINGAIITAVMLSPMVGYRPAKEDSTTAIFVPIKKPPPPNKPDEIVEPPKFDPIFTPKLPYTPPVQPDPMNTTDKQPDQLAGAFAGDGKSGDVGAGGETEVEKIAQVIFKKALRDMRFAKDFQPTYPPSLLVREIEGSATIRVLVGTDGRVREAQVVNATHPDFGKSAVRQAMKSWRFKPATRDGVAVEDWVTVPVSFRIN